MMFKVHSQIDYRLSVYVCTTLSQFCGFELFSENISWWCSNLVRLPFSTAHQKKICSIPTMLIHFACCRREEKNCSVHFIDIVYQLQLQKRASWLPLPMRTKTIALLLENVNSAVSVSDYVLEAKRLFNAAQFCGANIRARHCCLHARRSNYNT